MYEGVYVRTQDLEPIPIPPGRAMTRPRTDSSTASDPVLEIVVADFEEFFAREYPGLLAMLTALTGHRTVAEDLAQEAMVKAHQRWSRISGYDKPAAWLRRVAINQAYNSRARRRSEQRALARLSGERPAWVAELGVDDGGDEFWALVRRLPRRQAAAMTLHYLEDRPVAEVATILDCAEGTAKSLLHQGRANLARALQLPEDQR